METNQIYIIDNKNIFLKDDFSKYMCDRCLYTSTSLEHLCYENRLKNFETEIEKEYRLKGIPINSYQNGQQLNEYLNSVLPKKLIKDRMYNDSRMEYIRNDKPYTGYIYDYFTPDYDDVTNDEYGNLKYYQYYIHGRPIGIRVHFYPNGNLKRITHDIFLHDRFGIMFEWYEDGTLKYEGYSYYIYRHYDENGELVLEKKHLDDDEKRFIDSIESKYNEKIDERYFEIEDRELCTLKELFKEARQNGAEIREHIPNILPDNMNPPNAVRNPISLRKF